MPRKYDEKFKINTVKLVWEENLKYTQNENKMLHLDMDLTGN